MFTVERRVGRLVEIHVTSLKDLAEATQFRRDVLNAVNAGPSSALACVDLRTPRIFAPDVADSVAEMLKAANPKVLRSALLLGWEHATFHLQFERIIREANHPGRRLFRDPRALREWLGDLLTPAESARLQIFIPDK